MATTADEQLYDAATQRFSSRLLRQALVARGLSVKEVALRNGLNPDTIYRARMGNPVTERTAIAILSELAAMPPLAIL